MSAAESSTDAPAQQPVAERWVGGMWVWVCGGGGIRNTRGFIYLFGRTPATTNWCSVICRRGDQAPSQWDRDRVAPG